MFDSDKSLNAVVKEMADMGAAMMRMVGEGKDGTPLYAVVLAQGEEETSDLLSLLDEYEDERHGDNNPVRAMVAGPALLEALEGALPWLAIAAADDRLHTENASADLLAAQVAIAKAGGNPGRGINDAARAAIAKAKGEA